VFGCQRSKRPAVPLAEVLKSVVGHTDLKVSKNKQQQRAMLLGRMWSFAQILYTTHMLYTAQCMSLKSC
jgi:hypothetical protein